MLQWLCSCVKYSGSTDGVFQTSKFFRLLTLILHRFSCVAFEDKLVMMPETDIPILQEIRYRLTRVHENLACIIEAGDCSITPHVEDSAVSCPVRGLYFTNELGLNMHIKSGHPQVHDESRVEFVKARHAVNGIPQCFFCLKMFCDHHSLEKHVTMGGCSMIKTALSMGQTIETLEEETRQRYYVSPPEVPSPDQQRAAVLLKDNHPMFSANWSDLPSFSDSICAIGSRCILCGQIFLDKNRIKTHWRKSHPSAWKKSPSEALRVCGSLKSVFRSPCQFCNSTAKNLSLHATQCSTLFQVCAGHILQEGNNVDMAEADSRQPQARSSSVTPAYLGSSLQTTPLAAAFRVGAIKPANATTLPESDASRRRRHSAAARSARSLSQRRRSAQSPLLCEGTHVKVSCTCNVASWVKEAFVLSTKPSKKQKRWVRLSTTFKADWESSAKTTLPVHPVSRTAATSALAAQFKPRSSCLKEDWSSSPLPVAQVKPPGWTATA